MSDKDMIPFPAAVAGDVLSAFQLPGGNTLSLLGQKYLDKKRKEAAEILISEIQNGYHGPIAFEEHDVDPLIEIVYRFSKAVTDGSAKENLRFLAQVIAGLKKKKALDGDRFRRWAATLEQLTRDELLVLGLGYRLVAARNSKGADASNTFWQDIQSAMETAGFRKDEFEPLCASLSRYGLLVPAMRGAA